MNNNSNNINNNNNFNYNQPMQSTNQIYQNTQLNQQPIQNNNDNQKNNNKIFIIIAIVLLIIGGGIFYFTTRNKKLESEDNNNSNQVVEPNKDNNTNNSSENETIDNTNEDTGEAFLMQIEDYFPITGRGIVVMGKVLRGSVKYGDIVQIVGLDKESKTYPVTGIETFGTNDVASVNDDVGILLRGITEEDIEIGQVLATPNSIKAYKSFEATAKFLTKEEGGRHTPFYSNYKPIFHFRNIDVNSTITLPDNIEMVSPGDSATINVELEKSIAMKVGTEFDIMEGGRIIGTGKVTKIK